MSSSALPSPRSVLEAQPFARETAAMRPIVRAVIAGILREHTTTADVEDCTHEALRRALEGAGQLREASAHRAWVLGIARHVALDAIRARRRQRARADGPAHDRGDDVPPSSGRLELADASPSPFERVAQARRDAVVRRVMDELPDGPRRALVMFHLEGVGYQEIASRLGVPLGTVATWVTRGRKAMAATLAEEAKDA
jgi:RNA polymerase sigma-70 factor (ECF subfamily)